MDNLADDWPLTATGEMAFEPSLSADFNGGLS